MKKLFAIVISVVMMLGVTSLFACGSSFDGNYTEVTADKAQEFVTSAKAAETPVANIIFGMNLDVDVSVKMGDTKTKISAEAKSTVTDNEFKLNAKAEISGAEEYNGKYEAYATNGKVYLKMAPKGGEEGKMCISLDYTALKTMLSGLDAETIGDVLPEENGMANYMGIATTMLGLVDNLASVEQMFGEGAVKFYLDAEAHKFKISINVDNDQIGKIKGDVFLTFDKDYNFTGIKVDVEGKLSMMGETAEFDVEVTLEAYDGKVSVPSSFEGYGDPMPISALFGGSAE